MAEQPPEGQVQPPDGKQRPSPTTLSPATSQGETQTAGKDLVCNVDRSLIETFLKLVLDNYKRADLATFFLEQRSGIVNVQGITNVRDVLSHLVTLLSPETPDAKRIEQLHNAEEHLRRAINEPYEIALNELTVRFAQLYEDYKRRVLPIKDKYAALRGAPATAIIEIKLREIRELKTNARASKSKNLWNPEWEEGVTAAIGAYDMLFDLYADLEGYFHNAAQIENDNQQIKDLASLRTEIGSLRGQVRKETILSALLHFGGYFLAVLFGLIAIALFFMEK